jgi:hypothetical protein
MKTLNNNHEELVKKFIHAIEEAGLKPESYNTESESVIYAISKGEERNKMVVQITVSNQVAEEVDAAPVDIHQRYKEKTFIRPSLEPISFHIQLKSDS